MELQSTRKRPLLLHQQPNGIPSAAQTGCGSQGQESVSTFTADHLPPHCKQPPRLNSTHKAETFLWGLAEAARESDGDGICQELFSQPHGTDSARSWGHLKCHGKKRRQREVNQRLAEMDRQNHTECPWPTSQFHSGESGAWGGRSCRLLLPSAEGIQSSHEAPAHQDGATLTGFKFLDRNKS